MTSARVLAAVLLGAAVAAAVIALNVVLLGSASGQNDPAGRLTPRVNPAAAPSWTVRPTNGEVEDGGADD